MSTIMSASAQMRPEPFEVLASVARKLELHPDWLEDLAVMGLIPAVMVGNGDQAILRARVSAVQAAVDAIAESERETRKRERGQRTRRLKEANATQKAVNVEKDVAEATSG